MNLQNIFGTISAATGALAGGLAPQADPTQVAIAQVKAKAQADADAKKAAAEAQQKMYMYIFLGIVFVVLPIMIFGLYYALK